MAGEQPATVLVVDDEAVLAEVYGRWLEDTYEVETAYGGEEALEALDEAVDVVLLDRRMPELSGDAVLEELVDRGLECKVVMVTAVEPDFDILDMTFDSYVVKPIDRSELRAVVRRMLEQVDYRDLAQEYGQLVSRHAALKTHKPASELETSEEFAELEERLDAVRAELESSASDFDAADFTSLYRDLV